MLFRLSALFACASAFSVGVPRAAHSAVQQQQSVVSALPLTRATAAAKPKVRRSLVEDVDMMASKPLKIGVVGVTGAVGKEIIDVLGNRKFPVAELKLFASARSAGKPMATPFGELMIEEFTLESARACDVVFLAVSGDFALEWAEKIAEGDDGALEGCCRSQRKIAGAVGGHQGCGRVSPRATPVRPRSVSPLIGGRSGVCDRRTPLTPHPSPTQARSSSTTRRPSVTLRASRSWWVGLGLGIGLGLGLGLYTEGIPLVVPEINRTRTLALTLTLTLTF